MATIEIDTPEGKIDALLSVPEGKGPWPGVVVIHDAFGLKADNAAVAQRIAAAGYVALVPNMYARGGMVRCVTRVIREVQAKSGRALDDVLAARDHLKTLPECTGTVAIAGFCMGGQFALVLAPQGFAASAPFYGTPLPRPLDDVLEGACPIVASFGRRDPIGKGAAAKLQIAVDRKGITADVKEYPDVGHSFANKLPAQPLLRVTGFGYDDASTEDAWRRIFAFFAEHMPA